MDTDRELVSRELLEASIVQVIGRGNSVTQVFSGSENHCGKIMLDGSPVVCRLSTRRTLSAVLAEQDTVAEFHAGGLPVAKPLPLFDGKAAVQVQHGVLSANAFLPGEHREGETWQDFTELLSNLKLLITISDRIGWVEGRGCRQFKREIMSSLPRLCSIVGASDLERVRLTREVSLLYESNNRRVIVHGDIHRGNILWHAHKPEVAGMLDFDDCYNGTISDELYSFVRGYCFHGTDIDLSRLRQVAHEFCFASLESEMLCRLAAECVYFYVAIADSNTSGRGPQRLT